ncbi:uncharacterized protein EDB91DRAFT_1092697 [Suillus paluster]|uniref:uncharacterized protein n=1 Tax=Suillus paluster TaxID=48578 RepID=UPI001B87ADF6|nr:uncharacterized protein EDB91DRAFT_1092697 [Suillus paluster]KAG1756440.1 hypothetical protein EDB91DRAFT_1092697 [Suillus paluster]
MDKDPNRPEGLGPIIRTLHATISQRAFGAQSSTSIALKSENFQNPCDDDTRLLIQFTCDGHVDETIIFDMCRIVTQGRIQILSLASALSLCPKIFLACWVCQPSRAQSCQSEHALHRRLNRCTSDRRYGELGYSISFSQYFKSLRASTSGITNLKTSRT